jgi:dienelactone hydrolase
VSAIPAIVVLLATGLWSTEQTFEIPPGELVERVECLDEPDKSYALFAPSDYTAEKQWPVILFFDPGGRGAEPLKRYREVAERYGYVLAGSNDSRNFMDWNHQLESARAMWRDVTARASIDTERIYTAGFSGGARAAIQVALVTKSVPAVLAHGAGFPDRNSVRRELPFALVSAAGTLDMNWLELEMTHRQMDELGLPNRRIVFDGDHEWAPAETFETMIAWVELRAIRAGEKPTDQAWVEERFEHDRAEAELLESRGQLAEAFEAYQGIVADFRGLVDVGPVREDVQRLAASGELKKAIRKRDRRLEEERTILRDYFRRLDAVSETISTDEERRADLRWWGRELSRLDGWADDESNTARRNMALRLHGLVWRDCYERSVHAAQQGNHAEAVHLMEIAVVAEPTDPWLLYGLVRAHTGAGGMRQALDALGRAIDAGFDDRELLRNDPALTPLQDSARFKNLVGRIETDGQE